MRFVQKHDRERPPDVIKEVPDGDADALLRYWATPAGERSNEMVERVGILLAEAHRLGAWIECNCADAYLSPVEYHTGRYRVTRMSKRAMHEDNCPFHWEEGELGSSNATNGGNTSPVRLPKTINFLTFNAGEAGPAVGARPVTGKPRKSTKQENGLQRALFWLLNRSGLNVYAGSSLRRKDCLDKLTAVLNTTMISDGINLQAVTWWSHRAINEGWVQNRFDALRAKWPKNKKLQGYLILTADRVDREVRKLYFDPGNTVTVDGDLSVYGRPGERSGPYLVIATVVEVNKGRLTLPKAYAHPVASHSDLFVVDSDLEREASVVIEQFVKDVNRKKPGGFRALKPLEDYSINEKGCRPDFIVEDMIAKRMLVVETMGSDDPEYLARKKSTHTLMEELGYLFLDERTGSSHEGANERLHKALWRWYFRAHKNSRLD